MLGRECPRCRRRNPVGERASCPYCGASFEGEAAAPPADDLTEEGAPPDEDRLQPVAPIAFTDPDDVETTTWDNVKGALKSWPGFVIGFAFLFGGGVLFYERALVHYAPGLSENDPRDKYAGVSGKSVTQTKQDADKALEAIDLLLTAYAKEHKGFPETLGPQLEELAPYGDVLTPLASLADKRITSYKRSRDPGGKKEIYHLDARASDPDHSVTAIGGTYFPEE